MILARRAASTARLIFGVVLVTSTGSLFSGGKILVTDKPGLTRDRITLKKTATVTLNAGGTRHTFQVPLGD